MTPCIAAQPLSTVESEHALGPAATTQPLWRDAIARLRESLQRTAANPADANAKALFAGARREIIHDLLGVATTDLRHPLGGAVLPLVQELGRGGLHDLPLSPDDSALLATLRARRWTHLLAGMLLSPAWRWQPGPALEHVPDWLADTFARWIWAAPQGFLAIGDAELYATFALQRLEELSRWVSRNRGSRVVRANLEVFAVQQNSIPLYFNDQNLRRHAELRANLLAQVYGRGQSAAQLEPVPRIGRKLRVGFLNRHFASQTETYSTLPTFEHLDPALFEVILFALHDQGTPLEQYCQSRASEYRLLPSDYEQQVQALHGANLDVLVFGTNVTAVVNEVTRLALHRFAPLQIVNNSSPISSGMPTIDLYISGDLTEVATAPDHYTERLGLLPGPAHVFNYGVDHQEAALTFTREQLGLPTHAVVFVTAANYFKITPELQQAWAMLLAAVPDSHLLVHPFNTNWNNSYPVDRFEAQLRQALSDHGVRSSRLVLSRNHLPSRSDVKAMLSVGDIYLDSFPFSGVNSLVDPLEVGLPVVVWEGTSFRSRMAASLLRSLHLPDLVATDANSYLALATRFATDAELRSRTRESIAAAMSGSPLFLDALAGSDAFGDLLLHAFDELVETGPVAFRKSRTPLQAPELTASVAETLTEAKAKLEAYDPDTSERLVRSVLSRHPAHAGARRVMGDVQLARQAPSRAVMYLLSALNGNEDDASLWFDVARALQANQQYQEAIQTLETALRLDPKRVEAWSLVEELARRVGAHEMADEAASVIRELTTAA